MDFLETIERIRSEEASVSRLFGGEGRGARTNRPNDPAYLASLNEAVVFVGEVLNGQRPMYHLQEALSTSDFPLLFGDVIDRMLLGSYLETKPTYRAYMKVGQVPDFRSVKRFAIDGAESTLATVPELTEYPAASVGEGRYQYAVEKHGRRIPFSWETIINDDLGAFRDMVERMGRAARRSEEKFATDLFVDSTGPDATFFSAGNGNIITGNPALSVAGLQTGFSTLAAQTDTEGEPIFIEGVHLIVPPQLEVTAMNILNALEIRALTSGGGTSAQGLVATNWMKARLTLAVNYYLPIVDTTSGDTAWYLFADPSSGRPAAEVGFLRGHEAPEVFIKESNARRAGGGTSDPMDGDFDTDAIEYKLRHTFGGVLLDPKAAAASTG